MVISLVLPLVLVMADSSPAPALQADPPIRVWLNSNADFEPGDRAKVYLRAAEDGYVVVLRADGEGRVRVLFPLDPALDNFVRGGRKYEIRGRGDREAFLVEERSGGGVVLAAYSRDPFRFDQLIRGDHWDYRVIAAERVSDDREAGLLDLVERMAAGNRYDYDVASYTAGDRAYRHGTVWFSSAYYDPWCLGCWRDYHGWGSGFRFSVSFGGPLSYGYYPYDPFYLTFPYRRVSLYHRIAYGYGPYGYWGYRPYGYWRQVDRFCWGDPFCYRSGFYRANFAHAGGRFGGVYSRGGYTLGGERPAGFVDQQSFAAVPRTPTGGIEPRRRLLETGRRDGITGPAIVPDLRRGMERREYRAPERVPTAEPLRRAGPSGGRRVIDERGARPSAEPSRRPSRDGFRSGERPTGRQVLPPTADRPRAPAAGRAMPGPGRSGPSPSYRGGWSGGGRAVAPRPSGGGGYSPARGGGGGGGRFGSGGQPPASGGGGGRRR